MQCFRQLCNICMPFGVGLEQQCTVCHTWLVSETSCQGGRSWTELGKGVSAQSLADIAESGNRILMWAQQNGLRLNGK
ncbi:hypothetical protein chiPu_0018486 [Chiloscyllium punctatum]|uniref:Uncharacterized protein n=1 Tax=Chiloscyllium punctatum TaxID=137246 RepID=A0A401RNJ3_CHIPU|nr:hypothetical protein [Chiloscyllium punctatum]